MRRDSAEAAFPARHGQVASPEGRLERVSELGEEVVEPLGEAREDRKPSKKDIQRLQGDVAALHQAVSGRLLTQNLYLYM